MKHDPNKTVLGTFSNGAICYSYCSKYSGDQFFAINEPAKGLPYGLEVELARGRAENMIAYYAEQNNCTYSPKED